MKEKTSMMIKKTQKTIVEHTKKQETEKTEQSAVVREKKTVC